jgi:hypothetical protein
MWFRMLSYSVQVQPPARHVPLLSGQFLPQGGGMGRMRGAK